MKTFETEKGNIPDGATHYSEETDYIMFCWFKKVDDSHWLIMTSQEKDWYKSENFEWKHYSVKPIPQTKEVEWVNGLPPVGVECWFNFKSRTSEKCKVKYIGDKICVYDDESGKEYSILISSVDFSKIESEAEKLEREELEAAYDLYCEGQSANNESCMVFSEFSSDRRQITKNHHLAIVRKTEYRKATSEPEV